MDFMVSDETNPSSILLLPAGGARERARRARHAHHRDLGDAEPDLARVQPHAARPATSSATRAQFFEWVKFRSHLSRGVTVGTMLQDEAFHFLAPRHLPRARRQHGAPARREVPRAAAASSSAPPREAGPGVRLLSLERDPALGLGLRGLPQGLPRRDPARARGRAADPARRHAALAARLHARGGDATSTMVANEQIAETQRRAGKLLRRPAVRPHRRDPRDRAARVPDPVPRARQRARRRHQPRLPRPA